MYKVRQEESRVLPSWSSLPGLLYGRAEVSKKQGQSRVGCEE